jgi:16S rRNA (guanine527-N7)-methyltransferase
VTDPAAGIAGLVDRYQLPPGAAAKLLALVDLITENAAAPTTVRSPEQILNDHLADSLSALELPEVTAAGTVVDIGSGAGFPGLPVAIALPDADVTLLEANARKCGFIASVIAACGIPNASPVHTRAESWPEGLGRFDLAIARALAPLAVVAEYAAPLLRFGGILVVWRGRRNASDEDAAARAAAELGLEPREPVRVQPYAAAAHRHLHVMTKVAETPERFPRRSGAALKHPLGAARP